MIARKWTDFPERLQWWKAWCLVKGRILWESLWVAKGQHPGEAASAKCRLEGVREEWDRKTQFEDFQFPSTFLTWPFLFFSQCMGVALSHKLPDESRAQCDSAHKQNTGKASCDKNSSYKTTPNSHIQVCWRTTISLTLNALSASPQILGVHLWQCSFMCSQRKQMLSNDTSVLFISHNPRNPAWKQTNLT